MENTAETKVVESQFAEFQSALLPFAYNILGDSMEARDVVQEILNHYFLSDTGHIQNPKAYLVRSVINRSITEKKRIQLEKKKYLGEWLPVPVNHEAGIYRLADRDRIINYSLLVLLERLNPKERAVFILIETFDFAHKEVAEVLNTTVENSRQLYKRARQKLEPDIRKTVILNEQSKIVIEKLTEAIMLADVEKVKQLLSDEVRSVSDGGNKARAARKVLVGRDHVARFLQAIYGKYFLEGSESFMTEVNHSPAIIFKQNGAVYRCMIFEISRGAIDNLYIIVNPDKLQSI
ncbi:MAG: RNA polymerase subunit sigma-70 [Bacteroidetes bacterium]|nr:RNA polymerase subunit sigma-70 [Bacteroidota bacterium]